MSRKPRPKTCHAEAGRSKDTRRRIKVHLPPDLHRELKKHSHAHGVSMAHVIRTLVRHDLQNAGPVSLRQNGGRS